MYRRSFLAFSNFRPRSPFSDVGNLRGDVFTLGPCEEAGAWHFLCFCEMFWSRLIPPPCCGGVRCQPVRTRHLAAPTRGCRGFVNTRPNLLHGSGPHECSGHYCTIFEQEKLRAIGSWNIWRPSRTRECPGLLLTGVSIPQSPLGSSTRATYDRGSTFWRKRFLKGRDFSTQTRRNLSIVMQYVSFYI